MYSTFKKFSITFLSLVMVLCIGALVMMNVKPVKALVDYDFSMVQNAEIRKDRDDRVLRFTTKMLKSELDDLIEAEGADSVKVITMITPADYVEDAIEADSEFEFVKDSVTDVEVHFTDAKGNLTAVEEGDYYLFKACIYNIKDANMTRKFVARSYVEVDGTPVSYADYDLEANAFAIYDVAKSALINEAYEDEFEQERLQALCADYAVTIKSEEFADNVFTVKIGESLADYMGELMENTTTCFTASGIYYENGDPVDEPPIITSNLTLRMTYEYCHEFVNGDCNNCDKTVAPADSDVATFSSETPISQYEFNDEAVYNYKRPATQSSDSARITFTNLNDDRDILWMDVYVYENGYATDNILNLQFLMQRYAAGAKQFKPMVYDRETGEPVALGEAVMNHWYTLSIDISAKTASYQSMIMYISDSGTANAISMYFTNVYYTTIPTSEYANPAQWVSANASTVAYGHTTYKGNDVTHYYHPSTINADAGRMNVKITNDFTYTVFDLYVYNAVGAGGSVGAKVRLMFANYGSTNLNNASMAYEISTGKPINISSGNANNMPIEFNTWYRFYIDTTAIHPAEGATNNLVMYSNWGGGGQYGMLFDNMYFTNDLGVNVPADSAVADWYTETGASIAKAPIDGNYIHEYVAKNVTGDSGKLQLKIENANYNWTVAKMKVTSSALETEGKTGFNLVFQHYGSQSTPTYVYDLEGNLVSDRTQMLMNTYYYVVVDVTNMVNNALGGRIVFYPHVSVQTVSIVITEAYFVTANPFAA